MLARVLLAFSLSVHSETPGPALPTAKMVPPTKVSQIYKLPQRHAQRIVLR